MDSNFPPSPAPVKKVLVIQYSQSGQLTALSRQIVAPLAAVPEIDVSVETLMPIERFPFPWTFFRFLDAFPESAHLVPPALAPLSLRGDEDFDLVILPYQVWFLAPSQPIVAFLKHPIAAHLLRGKPVVTVIACRNMWLFAHLKMEALLAAVGARLIDNVVLTDPGPTLATFITTPRWMLSGKKAGFWGLPAAGLSDVQIRASRRFGLALREGLLNDRERGQKPLLVGLGAVQADPRLYVSERAGTRSFYLWGRLLMAAGRPGSWQRVPLLVLYLVFLIAMIIALVPTSLALQALLRPFMHKWLAKMKIQFERPSGSGTENFHMYED